MTFRKFYDNLQTELSDIMEVKKKMQCIISALFQLSQN